MIKQTFTLLALAIVIGMQAQDAKKDTSYWKTSGFLGLNFSQTGLSDWQGGGQDNISLNTIFNLAVNYKKGKHEWNNKLDAQYGIIRIGQEGFFKTSANTPFKKNLDQLFLLSKYNINAFNKYWYYAAQLDYRTQLAPGYTYDGNKIVGRAGSDFNSPGYLQLAIGLDYKPVNYFSATFAPLAGKITLVNRQHLADSGAYGVERATFDANGVLLSHGKTTRAEFGGRLIFKFKKDLYKKGDERNINLDSYLDLFSNYMNNPGNIDVIFNNLITFKINKYFTATLISQMLYDHEIIRKRDLNGDGLYNQEGEINGPRLQLLTTFGIGFGYKF